MAVFGSTINPALGRVDYSPLAQGIAQGGMLSAQGISNFGQGVTQGIREFLKRKEEKDLEKQGVEFIKSQMPGIDDKTALAGLKAAGGPAAFVKFQQDMAQSRMQQTVQGIQLDELKRGIAEQERLRQALATPPAASAIQAGARFEQLPTGRGAFSQAPSGVEDFISRAQTAGVSPSLYAQPALQLAQVQETLSQARQRDVGKPVIGYPTFEEANKERIRLEKEGAFGENTVGTVKFDNGRFVIESSVKLPRQIPDPELESRVRVGEKGLLADIEAGDQARRLLPQTNRMLSALQGGLTTGKLAPAKAALMSYAKAFGFDVDESQLATAEQFQAYATQQILGFFQQTKGGISNKENELFALMGPAFTRTTEGNKLLLGVIRERQKLEVALGDNARRGNEEGWSQAKIAAERRKLIEAYDAKLPDPAKLGATPISGEMPVLPQSPSGGLSPSTRALIPSR
jgi:hypothetical protein